MKIGLTEQQGRAVAAAARFGLEISLQTGQKIEGLNSVADTQSAYVGVEILEKAVIESVGSVAHLDGKEQQ